MRGRERIVGIETEIADAAALAEQHESDAAAFRERDVADRRAVAAARDSRRIAEEIGHQKLAANIGGDKAAVWAEPHRPDGIALLALIAARGPIRVAKRRAAPHGVIEPRLARPRMPPRSEAPNTPAGGGEIPAFRRIVELAGLAIVDARLRGRIERNRREAARLPARDIEEIGAALRAVIEEAEIGAVRGAQPVDHSGFQVGHEELLVPFVERDIAQSGPAVRPAIERDVGKHARLVTSFAIEPIDGAGTAAGAPHAIHPLRIVRAAMQPERRGRGEINVRR